MNPHRSKVDRDTLAALDAALPGYSVRKTKDHYMLEYRGHTFGIIGGNDNGTRDKVYRIRKLKSMIRRAQELSA